MAARAKALNGSKGGIVTESTASTEARRRLVLAAGKTYSIGNLAAEFDVTHRTIRFYEDEGLLSPRRKGTTRIYTAADRGRLALILRGKRLGFSISEIREFLDLYVVDENQMEQARFALEKCQDRLAHLEQQLKDLHQTRDELRAIEKQILEHMTALAAAETTGGDTDETGTNEPKGL